MKKFVLLKTRFNNIADFVRVIIALQTQLQTCHFTKPQDER